MGTDQQLFEQLDALRGSKTLIVGIGNALKGDDGAGPSVCEQLREAGISAAVIDAGTVPENYIQPIIEKDPRNLLVIDAVDFGGSPGAIRLLKPEELKPFVFSTHVLSPRLFVDMVLREIDVDVYFAGIQPGQTKLGQSLSEPVSRAVKWLSRSLVEIFPSAK